MKNERLFDALGELDADLICAAVPGSYRKKPAARRSWLSAAACLCLAVVLGLGARGMISDAGRSSEEALYSDVTDSTVYHPVRSGESGDTAACVATSTLIGGLPPTDAATTGANTTAYRFGVVTVGEIAYECGNPFAPIDAAHVGEALGETTAMCGEETIGVTYHAVVGVNPDCGIAVRFAGEEVFYAYRNVHYRPETLGDLIEDLNLREYADFGDVTVTYLDGNIEETVRFRSPDDSYIWEYLLSDVSAENLSDDGEDASLRHSMGDKVIGISVDLPLFGYENISLQVMENGYLQTNIFSAGKIFPIRWEQVESFVLALVMNCSDYERSIRDFGKSMLPAGLTWDQMNASQRFGQFDRNGITYRAITADIDAAELGALLGDVSAKGYSAEQDVIYTTALTCHAIRGIDPAFALAVQFPEQGESAYYVYTNSAYFPETLGDLVGDLNLFACMTFGDMIYDDFDTSGNPRIVRYSDPDDSIVWEQLFGDLTLPNMFGKVKMGMLGSDMSICCEYLYVENDDMKLGVNALGYLVFHDLRAAFYIGEERALAFMEYVKSNFTESSSGG